MVNKETAPATMKKETKPQGSISREQVITALKSVNDPEIGIDVWTLGLIYKIEIDRKAVTITMTLTTPMCPYGPMLMDEVKEKVEELGATVTLNLVFDPVWQPSDELRAMLGI